MNEDLRPAYSFCADRDIFHTEVIAARAKIYQGENVLYAAWFINYVLGQCPEMRSED